ncbi:MAG: metallophosphoesterase family protein [Candidatus Methylacidiphilales bacterium]
MGELWGICSDIHGNWEALQAVNRDMKRRGVTRRLCLGDVIGYGADPDLCLEEIMAGEWITLMGNHDQALLEPEILETFNDSAVAGVFWAMGKVSPTSILQMSEWPHVLLANSFQCVHASMYHPMEWGYIIHEDDALQHFSEQTKSLCFCGHTHVPMVWSLNHTLSSKKPSNRRFRVHANRLTLVNVGSVGQPRDGDCRASYVLFDSDKMTIQFRRVSYAISRAQSKIISAGLPKRLATRLTFGK